MKDLNYVANEIVKGRNLEINLPKYANSMMSLYNGFAYIKLSMNYYTYYEMLNDREYENADMAKVKDYLARLNKVIEKEVIGSSEADTAKESIIETDSIRNEITKTMEVVTSYADKLRIYEYILNRVEFRFSEEEFDDEYYMNDLTNDLMHYILADKDTMVVNSKISEIVGQLPMRMSKNKFFEYVAEAFSLYHGAQKGTVDDFLYSLRTVAMLDQPEGFEESFADVNAIYNDLKNADYKNLTQEEFKVLSDKLLVATQMITEISDLFVTLTQLVNDVYTIILSKLYAFHDVDEINKGKYVIKSIFDGFNGGEYDAEEDKLMDCFTSFEGQQEKILAVTSANEHAIEYVLKNESEMLKSMVLDKIFSSLEIITKLQSGSDFIALNDNSENHEIAADEYVDDAFKGLMEEFKKLFEDSPQIVSRAVMSTILSQLPVFFNNIDEIQNYINTSLIQCSDKAERMAFVEVMNMLMRTEE